MVNIWLIQVVHFVNDCTLFTRSLMDLETSGLMGAATRLLQQSNILKEPIQMPKIRNIQIF